MKSETLIYKSKGCTSKGFLTYDDAIEGKRPAVIIAHAWRGQDDFARQKALELTKLGFVAFAADLYGDGKTATTNEEAASLMQPLFINRRVLQERLIAAFEVVKNHPLVDDTKIGAIGFCFGGLSVIELLRSGVSIKGVVSFHGVLGDQMGNIQAIPGKRHKKINGSLLVLHGNDDPLVTIDDIVNLEAEMTENGADWQITIYGNTKHAFMNEEMQAPEHGLVYNPKTAKRAWQSMINFFNEIFG
jgi:dienelactone hydrolase